MSCLTQLAAVGMHLASWHADDGYNNFNPGIYIRPDCELVLTAQPQVGVFYNSEYDASAYAALVFELDRDAFVSPFLLVGAATGYEEHDPIAPLGSIGLRVGPLDADVPANLVIGFTPDVADRGSALVHFAIEWRFNMEN